MLQATLFFKCLSDATRLRCMMLLRAREELCVCELTRILGLSQPKISRHLALLRASGLIEDRRQGAWVHYRLHPALPAWAHAALQAGAEGVADASTYRSDLARLDATGAVCREPPADSEASVFPILQSI
jgi:ArsR family transcriptional regulator